MTVPTDTQRLDKLEELRGIGALRIDDTDKAFEVQRFIGMGLWECFTSLREAADAEFPRVESPMGASPNETSEITRILKDTLASAEEYLITGAIRIHRPRRGLKGFRVEMGRLRGEVGPAFTVHPTLIEAVDAVRAMNQRVR